MMTTKVGSRHMNVSDVQGATTNGEETGVADPQMSRKRTPTRSVPATPTEESRTGIQTGTEVMGSYGAVSSWLEMT